MDFLPSLNIPFADGNQVGYKIGPRAVIAFCVE